MARMSVSVPELAFVAGTRAMAGAGVALLLADGMSRRQRKALGFTLLAIGVMTTVPIAREVLERRRPRDADASG